MTSRYFLRIIVGEGTGMTTRVGVPVFNIGPPLGQRLLIWMRADFPQPAEERDDGLLLMECYSVMCPEGESGHVHPSSLGVREIRRSTFDSARERGWKPPPAFEPPVP